MPCPHIHCAGAGLSASYVLLEQLEPNILDLGRNSSLKTRKLHRAIGVSSNTPKVVLCDACAEDLTDNTDSEAFELRTIIRAYQSFLEKEPEHNRQLRQREPGDADFASLLGHATSRREEEAALDAEIRRLVALAAEYQTVESNHFEDLAALEYSIAQHREEFEGLLASCERIEALTAVARDEAAAGFLEALFDIQVTDSRCIINGHILELARFGGTVAGWQEASTLLTLSLGQKQLPPIALPFGPHAIDASGQCFDDSDVMLFARALSDFGGHVGLSVLLEEASFPVDASWHTIRCAIGNALAEIVVTSSKS